MTPSTEWLPVQRALNLDADGIPGRKTLNAVSIKLGTQASWQAVQRGLGITADGTPGPATARAVALKMGIRLPAVWPTQAEIRSGHSIFGQPGDESNLVMLNFPYTMYFDGQSVARTRCHRLVAPALLRIFEQTLEHYGESEIKRLHLDIYGGCYNFRKTVSGQSTSMHAWGIAVDIDPDRNGYSCKAPHAGLSRPECTAFWEIVESEGAISLGRNSNMDWMHFQFARIR